MDVLRIGVLGPLDVAVGGRPVDLTAGRQRALLAVLAMSAGRAVTMDRIAEAVWGARPPVAVRATVHTYVARLRAVLGAGAISADATGYVLNVTADEVDALRFLRLLDEAALTSDPAVEQALLGDALRLWRGTPFGHVPSEWLAQAETPRLVERRLAAIERFVDLRPDRAGLVAELRDLTALHPLRETLWARLLLLLQRGGRSAEALEQYAAIRTRLVDELGTDPGPELQHIYAELLAGKAPEPAAPAAHRTVPRQLPAAPQLFTGRVRELETVEQGQDVSTVVISAIDGMAGIGKTALAVHTAHRLAGKYPDGQLFIDLHGHTHCREPIEPAEALEHMLRALGVPETQMPEGLEQRAALYRTRLAGRRVLILLDNAAGEDQVLPLVPGAPGCLVLITSRRRLAGLDHTRTLSLDPLPTSDAVRLLVSTAGGDRLGNESPDRLAELAELAELCGGLPLAIRIAAGRLRSHPTWGLSHLIRRLRDQQHRLGELEAGQRSVVTALDLSYRHLDPDQQRAYRLASLHPGPDLDAYAAAALLGDSVPESRRILDQLLDVHLLIEPTAGRYRFHDLIRAHAANLAAADRAAPLHRLLDHYRHTAWIAMGVAYPFEQMHRLPPPAVRTAVPDLPDPAAALEWLDDELPNLLATARYAAGHDRHDFVTHLSAIVHRYLRSRSRYHDAQTLHQEALTAARLAGDQAGEADVLAALGHICRLLDRHADALDHFGRALRIARAVGHRPAELEALVGLGHVDWMRGRYANATDHFGQALTIARAEGHRPGELDALVGLGHLDWMRGRYPEAADHLERALGIAGAIGHRAAELNALSGLGQIERSRRRFAEAVGHYEGAARIAQDIGHLVGELQTLTGLGDIERLLGRYARAGERYQRVLDLARRTGDRNFEFEAQQGLGRLRHATGDPEAAVAHHDLALVLAGELGQPMDEARAHDGLAHAHHSLCRYGPAGHHWQRVLDILTGLGIDRTDDEGTTVEAIRAHLAALVTPAECS
ncbi:tetratricopeptide repeat protein [Actinoplanes sp. NBRC 103695]|uniref:AfsR/SARP family transcriptional regulator n=1 Tax=Actinoplanes sp. NBRC 103695 TaxID=3032202 RepID=UPI0025542C95|nr:tetratricopeptide repeat protein [Actinoplanes sp. NBRC 103695]